MYIFKNKLLFLFICIDPVRNNSGTTFASFGTTFDSVTWLHRVMLYWFYIQYHLDELTLLVDNFPQQKKELQLSVRMDGGAGYASAMD